TGFIDPTGQVVICPQFDRAGPFSEGLASVEVDGKWGFIAPY
ncbi:MAG: WG repeat-containing protein, partial [Anaerolineae bacterium]|nr:WG repeat-containing protein [Anaerolineae bacterium]